MADVCDAAQLLIDDLNAHPRRMPEGPRPTGRCLNCDEPLPTGHRWCDLECQTDHLAVLDRERANRGR